MENPQESFRAFMHEVAAGSQGAAAELVERYRDGVLRTVRSVMDTRLRSKFDADDFVQMVWYDLFSDPARLEQLNSAEELTAFLRTIARNIVISAGRQHLMTAKRGAPQSQQSTDLRREQSGVEQIPGGNAGPLEEVIARETLQRLLYGQPPEKCRIVQLRIEGHTKKEVADIIGTTRIAVYRVLKDLLRVLD
jgi:RNA polymerase sigma factor (sigma-70 family)